MTSRITRVAFGALFAASAANAQQPLNWAADDGPRIESLKKTGDRIEGANVIVYFPASLPRTDAEALVKRLDPAVDALWRLVGVHPWQSTPKGKITYYLHDDTFVAHAAALSSVFVPMVRVKDGKAPFLHETTHELLASRRRLSQTGFGADRARYPLWLTEGMADYIARVVADQLGITEAGPFGPPALSQADALCVERAGTTDGAKMVPFVGATAEPSVLFTTDRTRFAPTFYPCSLSLTKHLAERTGLNSLIGLFGSPPSEAIAHLNTIAGVPFSVVVQEWRARLGL